MSAQSGNGGASPQSLTAKLFAAVGALKRLVSVLVRVGRKLFAAAWLGFTAAIKRLRAWREGRRHEQSAD